MRPPSTSKDFSDQESHVKDLIHILSLDVADQSSISRVIETILEAEERIDVLVNNAGYGLYAPVELATEDEIARQFDVNVFGPLRLIRSVLPSMRRQMSGHIINISSIGGIVSNPGLGIYNATKHALEAISASLAATVFPWNIKVTVIQPGATATEFAEVMPVGQALAKDNPYKSFCEKHREHMRKILKEGQDPQEVASLIVDIIESEKPDFRYQTSKRIQETAKNIVVDPSGNQWLSQQKDLYSDWF